MRIVYPVYGQMCGKVVLVQITKGLPVGLGKVYCIFSTILWGDSTGAEFFVFYCRSICK